jgi:oxygen-independent coproporphyrinogen-3 oxidase
MVLDSGVLRVHRLLRRGPAPVRFSRVGSGGSHVESVRGTLAGRGVGIYIHIPYCRSTCLFCPYFRGVLRDRGELGTYLEALLREVELYGRALEDLDLDVAELHVGGGTPSLVPPRFYRELRGKLSEFFNLRSGVGIEVNPEDFRNPQLVEEFYACGVDEVSIGVQSFDARVLRSIGRKHGPEDGARAVENSLRAGFRWVNVDVMFLTPSIRGYAELSLDEKLRAFRRDLEEAVELGAHQVTYYATVVPRGSPGYRLVEMGRVNQEVDSVDRFVEEALDFAEDRGLHLTRVYSVSRGSYEYATVNLEMVGPLLGFGAGAWSNTGYYQYVNVHDVGSYVELVREGRYPAIYSRRLGRSSRAWRLLFDQLSATAVRYDTFNSLGLGIPLGGRVLLNLMVLAGLARRTSYGYRLTRRGIVEVYKSVMNYVVELPVKATEVLRRYGNPANLPVEVLIG